MNNLQAYDCHVHITSDGKWFNTGIDASLKRLLQEMDNAQIEKSIVLPIYGHMTNSYIKNVVSENADRLIAFGTTSIKNYKDDFVYIIENNFKGVKLHPRIQNETIYDWHNAGILKIMEDNNLPLMICGWQQTNSSVATMSTLHPRNIDEISKKYKNLKIILAHFGGHKFLDAFFCARGNENVFLDCSYFFQFFKNTSLENDALILFNKVSEKVIFGSDFPEINIVDYKKYFEKKSEQYKIDLTKLMSFNISKILKNE